MPLRQSAWHFLSFPFSPFFFSVSLFPFYFFIETRVAFSVGRANPLLPGYFNSVALEIFLSLYYIHIYITWWTIAFLWIWIRWIIAWWWSIWWIVVIIAIITSILTWWSYKCNMSRGLCLIWYFGRPYTPDGNCK